MIRQHAVRYAAAGPAVYAFFLITSLFAQTQSPGHWDYILGKFNEREYVYAILVDGDQVFLGGNFDQSSEYGGFGIKGIARYFRDGRMEEVGGGVHGQEFEVRAICQTGKGLVIGGHFVMAGGTIVNNVALFDGQSWQALAGGVNSTVFALAEYRGEIYAGGEFTRVNGQRQYYIAKWDGTQWSAVGEPLNGPVHAMIVFQDRLIVGGRFGLAGDMEVNHLAAWDGREWFAFGGGTNGNVLAMTVQGNDLIIGGRFEIAGGVTVNKIARWNGSTMEPVGQGFWGNVYALALDGDDIYAGGEFTRAAGYDGLFNYIARWNGSEWQKLSDGLDAPVYALGVKGTDVFIGGKFKTNPGIKFIPVGPVGPVINGFAFADQFHFIRWRNPVPDVPFNRNISPPFDGYADYGYGVSWRDFDTDGDEDIIISAMNSTVILKNSGEKAFERVPESPVRSWPELNSWADFDNDGDDDVINAGFRGPSSYTKTFSINKGNGLFEKSDAFNFSPTWWVWSGAWGDLDNDGYADFILQNFDPTNVRNMQILMYRNIRADHFSCEEVDASRDFFFENGHISWSDMDDDGDIDLLYTPSQWFLIPWNLDSYQQVYLNSGGQFIKAEAGDLTQESMQSSMAAWGDYDNDGDFDVFISVLDGHNALFQNQGDGSFIRMTDAPMCQDGGSSTFASWCDFDIDGDLDLFVMNRKHGDNFMYENLGNGTFLTVLDNQFTNLEQDSELGAWYDYDRDGDQDLFMVSEMNTPFYMMENTQSTENHWLNLKLTGIKSNRNALGAKVHVKSMINGDLVIQTREVNGQAAWSQSSLEQVIGLGDAQLAHIIIEWPSGIMQVLIDADADQFLCIEEDTALDGLEKPAGLSARTILELGLEGELAQASKPAVPESYDLSSCYPNPFNPSTEISYALPRESVVTIRVINALGQEVRMLLSEKQDAGTYRVRWDGLDLRGNAVPSGLYLCRMESDGFVQTQKMMLVR